jgi:hypothetical protein
MQEGGEADKYPDTGHAPMWAWLGIANDAVPDEE